MTTITLPPEIAVPLTEAAERKGTTPELLALESLRQLFPANHQTSGNAGSLFESLAGFIGAIPGPAEAFSENCGERFAQEMLDKQRLGRL